MYIAMNGLDFCGSRRIKCVIHATLQRIILGIIAVLILQLRVHLTGQNILFHTFWQNSRFLDIIFNIIIEISFYFTDLTFI